MQLCTTVLHGGVCHRTSIPHKSGNKMKKTKIYAIIQNLYRVINGYNLADLTLTILMSKMCANFLLKSEGSRTLVDSIWNDPK